MVVRIGAVMVLGVLGCGPQLELPPARVTSHGRVRAMELGCQPGTGLARVDGQCRGDACRIELCGVELDGRYALVCRSRESSVDGAVEAYGADGTLLAQGACRANRLVGAWAHWSGERLARIDSYDGASSGPTWPSTDGPPASRPSCAPGTTEVRTVHDVCINGGSSQCLAAECGVSLLSLARGSVTVACARADQSLDGPVVIESPAHAVLVEGTCVRGRPVGAWLQWSEPAAAPSVLESDGLWLSLGTDHRVFDEGQIVRDGSGSAMPVGFEWRRQQDGSLGKYDPINGAKLP